jgi:NUMOD4 motif
VSSPLERWLQLEDFEGYAVSDLGRVCNLRRDAILNPTTNNRGIAKVNLIDNDRRITTRSVASLVAQAFLEKPSPIFDTPIQLDGDRTNCHVRNLMWRPRWFAVKYHQQFYVERFRFGRRDFIDVDTEEVYEDYIRPCTTFGLIHTGIILSYLNHERVFPTRQRFELI